MDVTPDLLETPVETRLRAEAAYAPTHIMDETGIRPLETRPEMPSALQVSLFEEPEVLITGLEWAGLALAMRIDIMIAVGLDIGQAQDLDVLEVLPEQSKLWLTGWQQQVNSGHCWCTSGSIGRVANDLLEAGFLLLAPDRTRDWMGQELPAREEVRPGSKGSPLFVQTIMGERYLRWIEAIA